MGVEVGCAFDVDGVWEEGCEQRGFFVEERVYAGGDEDLGVFVVVLE